jgi:hypothetical protein
LTTFPPHVSEADVMSAQLAAGSRGDAQDALEFDGQGDFLEQTSGV